MGDQEETNSSARVATLPQVLLGEWQGTFTQYSHDINEAYPMVLRIQSIDDQHATFSGEMYWEKLKGSTPTIEGQMRGSVIEWTETIPQDTGRIKYGHFDLQGTSRRKHKYVGQGRYHAVLESNGRLVGRWYQPDSDGGDEGGSFELTKLSI